MFRLKRVLQEINSSSTELPLTISYDSIALGKLRFWIHMQDAVYSLQQFGKNRLTPRGLLPEPAGPEILWGFGLMFNG